MLLGNKIMVPHGHSTDDFSAGRRSVLSRILLKLKFDVSRRNMIGVADMTHIRRWVAWLTLAAVRPVFSRAMIGSRRRARIQLRHGM